MTMAAPLYGTCTMSIPAIMLNSAPAKWGAVPFPGEPKLSWPGFARASSIRSFDRAYRQRGVDHQQARGGRRHGDRREVLQRIVRQLAVKARAIPNELPASNNV